MVERSKLKREAIASIGKTTGLFYQQNTKDAYANLEQTLYFLSELANIIASDDIIKNEDVSLAQKFNEILKEALQALEEGDTILFSDILEYNLKELLEDEL